MTAVEAMPYPAWLVPALLGACGLLLTVCAALLGGLFKIYLDDRRQNALEHARLANDVKEAKAEVKAEVKEVKAEVKEAKAEVKEVRAEVKEVRAAVADLSVVVGRLEGYLLGPGKPDSSAAPEQTKDGS